MRTSSLLPLGAATLLACGASPPPAPPPTAGPAPAAEAAAPPSEAPSPAEPAEPAADDPEVARRKRVDEALARVPALEQELAALRGLPFKTSVPSEYQSTADFRAFVAGEVATELGGERGQAMSAAYHHIGLLADKVDLSQTLSDALVTQAAAYYDPKQAKFFVVVAPADDMSLDTIAVHELTHALQDQHFDLEAYYAPGGKPLHDDAANARRFVVEGEATLTMMVHATERMTGGKSALAPELLPMMRMGIEQAAGLSLDDLKAMAKAQGAGAAAIDDEIRKSMDSMDAIPPLVLVPMMDSYMKGARLALAAYEAGGWDEVGKLYATPPDSTEQALHPDKLWPKRDVPRTITLPTLKGYTEVHQNTVGELQWRVFFHLWNKAAAEPAAAGWDGDRWAVLTAPDGATVGVIVTTWDAPGEAKEFAEAYRAAVKARFPGGERQVWVEVKGTEVYVVDGGTDAKLIKQLVKGARLSKTGK